METGIITEEDMNYLTQQSSENLNMILFGMTELMESNNRNIQLLENQTWYQRMAKTLSGKNKMIQQEVEQNHDKINMYMSKAMSELFNRNCIDHKVLLGLGNRLSEIYEDQIQLKQLLGAFVSKLNEKIESVDNFHMLITEIEQGVYSTYEPMLAISTIMSQLDVRTIKDARKIEILERAVIESDIINDTELPLCDLLCGLLNASMEEAGVFALMFRSIKNNYTAELIGDILMEYYFIPDQVRKMKSRSAIVKKIFLDNQIDLEYSTGLNDLFVSLLESYVESVVIAENEEKSRKDQENHDNLIKYTQNSVAFVNYVATMWKDWCPNRGEFANNSTIEKYHDFINGVMDNLQENSNLWNNLKMNAINMGCFYQKVVGLYPEMKSRCCFYNNKEFPVNQNGEIKLEDDLEYYSLWDAMEGFYANFRDGLMPDENGDVLSLDSMYKALNTTDYMSFFSITYIFEYLNSYADYYEQINKKLLNRMDEESFDFRDVYDLVNRYPIDIQLENYKTVFSRPFDFSKPYIAIEYDDGRYHTCYGQADLFVDDSLNVKVHVYNIDGFTLNVNIIKNSCVDDSFINSYNAFDISHGDFDQNCDLYFTITKINNDCNFHGAICKLQVEEQPECVALLGITSL